LARGSDRKNPQQTRLKRALRVDKVRLAALEAGTTSYGDPARLAASCDAADAHASQKDIDAQARRCCGAAAKRFSATYADRHSSSHCSQADRSAEHCRRCTASAGIAVTPAARTQRSAADALSTAGLVTVLPVIGHINGRRIPSLDRRVSTMKRASLARNAHQTAIRRGKHRMIVATAGHSTRPKDAGSNADRLDNDR